MKVVIGSKSKDKVEILQGVLKKLGLIVEVVSVEVDSQITNQPLDKETTLAGAKNRARNAFKKESGADLAFGLEGGLHNDGDGYYLVTYVCLIDKKGNEYIGQGQEIKLPSTVSDRVVVGEWFGEVIRDYAMTNEIDKNLITRRKPFLQAIQAAYASYLKNLR